MIEQTNIPIKNKDTKKIKYTLLLDGGYWVKSERNVEGRTVHIEDSYGERRDNEWVVIGNEIFCYYDDRKN